MSRGPMDSLDLSLPEISPISANFFADGAMRNALATDMPQRQTGGITDGQLTLDNPYPQQPGGQAFDQKKFPLLDSTFAQQIKGAKSLDFTTPDDNKGKGEPDYRLTVGPDGKLKLEKVGKGDPLKDGKLNVEVDPQNKSLVEAIKNADKNLKEYIREMMQYWNQEHPGETPPGWWTDILNGQPDLPQDAQPVPITNNEEPAPGDIAPPPSNDTPPSNNGPAPGSDGGSGGGGGGSGGGGGGGGGGYGGGGDGGGYGGGGGGGDGSGTQFENFNGPDVNLNDKAPVAMQIMDYFVEKGLTPQQAAGIVGNMQRESGLDPSALEGGSGPGFGLVQWSFGRRENLENYAQEHGKPASDLKTQLDFLWGELNGPENKTLQDFKANPNMSASEAAQTFCQDFERPGVIAMDDRVNAANQFMAMYENGGNNGADAVKGNEAIVNAAQQGVGDRLWAQTPWAGVCEGGNLGCAASVSVVLERAGYSYAASPGVDNLVAQLKDNGWEQVPVSQAQPGDVLWNSHHIGLKAEGDKVYDNSSSSAQFEHRSISESGLSDGPVYALRPPQTRTA